MSNLHICQPEFRMLNGMKEFYEKNSMIATSDVATIALIRSHIAYWSGSKLADLMEIKPSRGHSYKIRERGVKNWEILKITDYFDHRNGVTGWRD